MTKKKFLLELEQKLSILEENEKKEIVNEYKDIIEEKIKHGKSEKEAILEFGDIEFLTDEILKAYKINPNFKKEEKSDKTVSEKGSDFVKSAAKELTEFTTGIVEEAKKNNVDFKLENVFELMIKILLLLIGLALLRLPFHAIDFIGSGMLQTDIFPFMLFELLWKVLVWVFYLISCVLVATYFLKDTILFFKKNEIEEEVKQEKKEETKTENKAEIKKEQQIKKMDEKKTETVKDSTNPITSILLILLKIFVILTFFIPTFGFLTGVTTVFSIAIYLLIKGVDTVGIIIICGGIYFITAFFINIVSLIFKTDKKIVMSTFFTGVILVIFGSIYSIDTFSKTRYINDVPSSFKKTSEIRRYEDVNNIDNSYYSSDIEYIEDNTLGNNELEVEFTYYKDQVKKNIQITDNNLIIDFDSYDFFPGEIISSFVKELKNKKIFNYENLYEVNIVIKANSETIAKLEK